MERRVGLSDLEIVFENTLTLIRSFLKYGRAPELTLERIDIALSVFAIFLRHSSTVDPRTPLAQVATHSHLFAKTSRGILTNTTLRPELKLAYLNRQCATAEEFIRKREEHLHAAMLESLLKLAEHSAQPPTA